MVAVVKKWKRAPSAKLARSRFAMKKSKDMARAKQREVEAKHRSAGGYGRGTVSVWEVPAGGIEKSPAYRLVLSRCGGTLLPPKDRAGAPVKGGYPLEKYPPNMLVDAQRAHWLPDAWAQSVKNTGPGGTYIGFVSPQGKYYYHRRGYPQGVEETLGRKLTALDGFNGILRSEQKFVNPKADKKFLQECLTKAERSHVLKASNFHFAVVSAFRATSDSGQHDLMHVEAQFRLAGVRPTWYVDAGSLEAYKALGLNAVVGGKLTPARNMALDVAKRRKQICVQVSDDIAKWQYYDVEKQNLQGEVNFKKANEALAGTSIHHISPVAAAQWLVAKMRSSPLKPKLGGCFPTANATMTMGSHEFGTQHFILGDFFAAEPSSPCRFDNSMTLKEDYDYTCSHIKTHGSVLRCNRLIVHARHSTNEGGAVAARDSAGKKERQNIAILMKKWPGVFRLNGRRKHEVVLSWPKGVAEQKDGENKPALATVPRKGFSATAKKMLKRLFPHSAKLVCVSSTSGAEYISRRCKKCHNRTVGEVLGMPYQVGRDTVRKYGVSDLRYDINAGRLKMLRK